LKLFENVTMVYF